MPKSDTKNYTSAEDLKGEVVGAQVGTAYVDALKKTGLFAEVKVYDTIPDILRDVNTGRLKAGYADYPILAYNLRQGKLSGSAAGEDLQAGDGRHGRPSACARATANLKAKINASLAKLKENGTLAKILDKWGLGGKGG